MVRVINRYIVYTTNEGPVRFQYKCLVPIYVFPAMKLIGLLISKYNYNVHSPNFRIYVFKGQYIPRIDLPILRQPNRQTDTGNIFFLNPSHTNERRSCEQGRPL
jgi:hypothetical protein